MLSKAQVSFMIIFLSLVSQGVTFEFLPSGEEGVVFGDVDVSGVQNVDVDENNDDTKRVKVVIIDKAASEPTFVAYENEDILQIQIVPVEGQSDQYYVEIISLNYETIPQNAFTIQIKVSGDEKYLQLNIQNLDDESPTLTATTCKMKENTTITVDSTDCAFTVQDPDGFLAKMDFSNIISNGRNEDKLFKLVYKETPGNQTKESSVYLVLQEGQLLDYETVTLYTFHVNPKDGAGHPTTPIESIPIIVQVIDIPDRPPIWTSFTSSKQIMEETEVELIVAATDGDYGIANEINYRIENGDDSLVTIDEKSGKITIKGIDRDGPNGKSSFSFDVTAFEVGGPDKTGDDSTLTNTITLIIQDADDNKPEISIPDSSAEILNISIPENSQEIVPLLQASDIDLGDNAMYTINLVKDDTNPESEEFIKAFAIIPTSGYETTPLRLTVTDPKKLDYENSTWRTITFNVHTEGTKNNAATCTFPVKISLTDLNDEAPVFRQEVYNVNVSESYTTDLPPIVTIVATDDDAEDADGVQLELLGTLANSILEIESPGGNVTAKGDGRPFDYEKQNVISIQVKATDKNNNFNTVELIINVIDLNDEPPRLTVGQGISIEENQEDKTVLTTTITASDEDKSAALQFRIDWDKSSATKNSAPVKDEDFENKIKGCITVETITSQDNNQEATAQLSIHEIDKKNTPDYELFDTLLLTLTVEDTATDSGYKRTDSAKIYISIVNLNDNDPEFRPDTITDKTVVENAEKGSTVGVVTATDKDNMKELTYSIQSADDKTPEWINIDNSGNLLVKDDANISCDYPNPREFLTYTVTVSDGDHQVSTNITIKIIDINNQAPDVTQDITISIDEDNEITNETLNGATIYSITYSDNDYSEPFHTVSCMQSSTDPIISQRFRVVDNTIVVNLQGQASLNREENPQFSFQLQCLDDPNHTGSISNPVAPPPVVTIILLDVNDKKPKIITTDGITLNENSEIGTTNTIRGEDGDTEERGEINFSLTKIQRTYGESTSEDLLVKLFSLEQDANKKDATLTLRGSLKGYYGQLALTVITTDNGTPAQSSENTITIDVEKYNFEEPQFTFPDEKKTYFLSPNQDPDQKLKMWNGNNSTLDDLEAWDQQGNKFPIDFTIASDGSKDKIFTIANQGRAHENYKAELRVKKADFRADEDTIEVILNAKINTENSNPLSGEAPYEKNCTMKIHFYDKTSDPLFDYHEDEFDPKENDTEVYYDLKSPATYPVDLPDLPVAYYLYSGDEQIFQVNKTTGRVTLAQALDYEVQQEYTIIIQASNDDKNPSKNPKSDSLLTITIKVQDINDNWPAFAQSNYFETLVYKSVKTVAILTATDADESSKTQLRYSIIKMVPNPDTLTGSFNMNPNTGKIDADFDLTQDMKGYYTLTVQVQDEKPESHTNTAEVKIYIVGTPHLVEFRFKNSQETVQKKKNSGEIGKILDEQFPYKSNIEDTTYKDNATTVPIYFLDTTKNEPVEGVNILDKVTNAETFNKLSSRFSDIGLNLMNFQTDTDTNENIEEILKGCLIGVSVVLGSLCLALLVAFVLKTRALNQRIKNLSNTKFGSQESGLNRQGVNAPTTNKHAIEGSNPVYSNNEVDEKDTNHYDPRLSVTSGDSDLIGVEDDDKFNYNYPTKDDEYNSIG